MGLGRTFTTVLEGVLARVVTIEANVGAGLPGIHIVGMADTGISEARSRIRTAVANSSLAWPKSKIVVSLAPANLPKSGSHTDLPIALAVLCAGLVPRGMAWEETPQQDAAIEQRLATTLIMGELGLDGTVHAVPGVIPALVEARRAGYSALIIPPGNAPEAALVPDMDVFVAHSLEEAFAWARGTRTLRRATEIPAMEPKVNNSPLCFSDIAGQHEAKFAAEVAAAGGHHLLMIGPPGAGKSMIAARLPGILPQLGVDEAVEATAIHSIAGSVGSAIADAPFVAPHSSITRASLLGGGAGIAKPGAVSLAHHGVLFLDEASGISAHVLDSLRAPLEEGVVRLVRSRREVVYPARFQLVLAANPCRCGAGEASACRCKASERANYLSNLSGPLRDRIDMTISLDAGSSALKSEGEEASAAIAGRVAAARERSAHRWRKAGLVCKLNSAVDSSKLRRQFPATEEAMELLRAYLATGQVSQRGVDRALRLSWTLADLAAIDTPGISEVSRALDLRASAEVGAVFA